MPTNAIIQKAFNAGYLIEKYLPKVSKVLVKGFQDHTNPYVEGFVAGSKEMTNERTQNKIKFLSKLKDDFGKQSPSKGKDKGGKEMDIDI